MVSLTEQFNFIKISLASPEMLKKSAQRILPNGKIVGEVKKTDTINYRTFKPEINGLFCEKIFGPVKSGECSCGLYKHYRKSGIVCDMCHVEITDCRVRRHRMGYIKLLASLTHIWYLKARPSFLSLVLKERLKNIEKIVYFSDTPKLEHAHLINIPIYLDDEDDDFTEEFLMQKYLKMNGKKHGVELMQEKLLKLNLKKEIENSRRELFNCLNNEGSLNVNNINDKNFHSKSKEKEIFNFDYKNLKQQSFVKTVPEKTVPEKTFHLSSTNTTKYQNISQFKYYGNFEYNYSCNYFFKDFIYNKKFKNKKLISSFYKSQLEYSDKNYQNNLSLNQYKFNKKNYKVSFKNLYPNRIDLYFIEITKRRLRILESFLLTNTNPGWMILSVLPVIPPGLRPMIQLEGGRFVTSDLNELYRKVIMRNNRLKRLFDISAPDMVIRNEKRLLQEAVDNLIDNGKRGELALDLHDRPFKSLSNAIEGKQGRFRQNLLGKRVDYSGRSVITVEPKLKLFECGLPYEMAIELYKPFLIYELIEKAIVSSIKAAEKIIGKNQQFISYLLEKILKKHPIILNRAPTLHRLSIQAFYPILVHDKAILLHPLVCSAFNADFDGDQMAVHLPLSIKAQSEALSLLSTTLNFLSPATGLPVIVPSQDMLLGCYYLTTNNLFKLKNSSHYFASLKDAILAYETKQINLHSLIWVRYEGYLEDSNNKLKKIININSHSKLLIYKDKQIKQDENNKILVTYIRTTVGRIIFNDFIEKSVDLKTKNFLSTTTNEQSTTEDIFSK
uniref:RNA polymerase beta' subunit n=1 Tax=Merotricha bacillata TaxID=658122 RepID=UPI002113E8C7|nr:RNA polymerase beta' subunit [Merotricha bacillata]UTE94532.1 RNA polymerase beta' subunit [Merotricha bacillata]